MVPARPLLALMFVVVSSSCGSEDGGSVASSTTSAASTTPAPPSTVPPYGSPCEAGSHPDCIDPDGDGEHEYLRGGEDCMKAFPVDSGLCSDLDGDGRAGYPDSG